ncbi:MAG: carboxypeptidase [Alphaproteobacteria bacterium]|nr:carboxypeptidase [Alphaproteobacteria bacterium]
MVGSSTGAALALLSAITGPIPVKSLDESRLRELQTALSLLGYPVGDIDGLFGPKTRSAWAEFKTDVFSGNPDLIGPESVATLKEKLAAIGSSGLGELANKESTIAAIKDECRAQGIGLSTQVAYVLATTQWETAQTFKPVKEAFWLSEEWRKNNLRYYPYYGRGFVQLTWKDNYQKYTDLLGKDLVNNPDLALEPQIALFVLVHGFKTGIFTGRKITDYITEGKTDFVNARRCINGLDKAHEIAALAQKFLA